MRTRLVVTLLISTFCAPLFGVEANAAVAKDAKVMIVGVPHLVARHDVHNSVFKDDPLSTKRQAQIVDIVARLERFHPTKVLIEAPMGNPDFAIRYRRYLAGDFTLPANEIYQFGFRLAARARNAAIYPIDADGPALIDENTLSGKRIMGFLKAHFSTIPDPSFEAFLTRSNALERDATYLDVLRYLNTDAAIRANASVYSVLDGMGRDADNAGSAYVSQWYARNAYIFSNIVSTVASGDRIAVIMGQGHEYLLREFVRLHPGFIDVNPSTYLH